MEETAVDIRHSQRGFTLIELMTVVVVIGILAAVAFPIYQNYVARTRMAEVVMALSACRTPISEVYQSGSGSTGPGADNWGCERSAPASRYAQAISTDASGKIGGVPADPATDMGKSIKSWRCGSTADGTTVPVKVLPSSCQGS
jgi:type IV pilus assembly protein PilA